MSKAGGIDVSLTSLNVVPTLDEENWTYITAGVLEQTADFEEWLDKNGVRYIITNDYLEDSMISPKPDDLLTQNNVQDFPVTDDNETFQFTDLNINSNTEKSKKPKRTTNGNTDKNMNSVPKQTKCSTLENSCDSGIYMELVQEEDILKLLVRNSNGDEIIPSHCVSPNEVGGQIKHPFIRQLISVVSRVQLSEDYDLHMPKMQTEQGLKVFLCPHEECHLGFMRLATAKLHSLVHLEHKPYKCTFPNCTWAFYTPFKLRRHQDTHFKRKDFVCPIPDCARRFTTIYNLNGHKRLHERPADLPCPVQKCNQMFQTTRARQIHLRTHRISEASFECTEPNCNKKFFTQTSLQSHTRSHSHKETDLQCQWPNCGKVFEQPYRLKEHERFHTGQRPYCCSFEDCKWSFPTASKLKRHQSTHTNDRKFHCTIGSCNKSFLRPEHLREHTLTHIGQRTYVCEGKKPKNYNS